MSKDRGDLRGLMAAKNSMNPDAWGDVAATISQGLGRDSKGNFSGGLFLRDFNEIPEATKRILFSKQHLRDLTDIATISEAETKIARYANTSKSGSVTAGTLGLGAAFAAPFKVIPAAISANLFARWLARPLTARPVADWSRAYAKASTAKTVENMRNLNAASLSLATLAADDEEDDPQAKAAKTKEIYDKLQGAT
jgi:hypothetical protein